MKNIFSFTLFSTALAVSVFFGARSVRINSAYAQGAGNCGTGWVDKINGPGPVVYSGDQAITSITVKAGSDQSTDGNECITFTSDDDPNECYDVVGIGTTSVTVTEIGSGPTCKDISHVEFYASSIPDDGGDDNDDDDPTPTEPTPDPTSTPTPRPTPAPKDAGEVDYPKTESTSPSSQGQVLGASTMAATGSFSQDFGMLLVVLGALSAYASAKAYQKVE